MYKGINNALFSILFGISVFQAEAQESRPERFKGKVIEWQTKNLVVGQLEIPGEVTVAADDASMSNLTSELAKSNGFTVDIIQGYIMEGGPVFDKEFARQLATVYGSHTIEKEECKENGECYFEVVTASRLNYITYIKPTADKLRYFNVTAGTAMGTTSQSSFKALSKAIKASKGENSLDDDLRFVMEYVVKSFNPAELDEKTKNSLVKMNEQSKKATASYKEPTDCITPVDETKTFLAAIDQKIPNDKKMPISKVTYQGLLNNAADAKGYYFVIEGGTTTFLKSIRENGHVYYVVLIKKDWGSDAQAPIAFKMPADNEFITKRFNRIADGGANYKFVCGNSRCDLTTVVGEPTGQNETLPYGTGGELRRMPVIEILGVADNCGVWKSINWKF